MSYIEGILERFYLEFGTVGLITAGALTFVAIANTQAVTGEHMERPHRIGQLYGYTVCLVAVVTFLTSTNSLIKSLFILANPISYSEEPFRMGFEPSLSSFDAFRATYMFGTGGAAVSIGRGRGTTPDTTGHVDTLTTAELRTRYEALRNERIGEVWQSSLSQIVTSLVLILLAGTLFAVHWRWLRAREREAAPA